MRYFLQFKVRFDTFSKKYCEKSASHVQSSFLNSFFLLRNCSLLVNSKSITGTLDCAKCKRVTWICFWNVIKVSGEILNYRRSGVLVTP